MINTTDFYSVHYRVIRYFHKLVSYGGCRVDYNAQLNKLSLKSLACLFVNYEANMNIAISYREKTGDEWDILAGHCLARMVLIINESIRFLPPSVTVVLKLKP